MRKSGWTPGFLRRGVTVTDVATFFLDSIDELRLSLGSFEQALKCLNRAIGSKLGQSRIVITTRPIDELRLSLGSFELALKRLKRVIGSKLRQSRIINDPADPIRRTACASSAAHSSGAFDRTK